MWDVPAAWAPERPLRAPKLWERMHQWAELAALLIRVFGCFPFQFPSLNFLLCLDTTCSFLYQGLFLTFVLWWLLLVLFFFKYLLQVHFRGCVVWDFLLCWRALSNVCLHLVCSNLGSCFFSLRFLEVMVASTNANCHLSGCVWNLTFSRFL